MLGAVIRNGNNTLVVELPTGTMDLQTKLSSIGITQTADPQAADAAGSIACAFHTRRAALWGDPPCIPVWFCARLCEAFACPQAG